MKKHTTKKAVITVIMSISILGLFGCGKSDAKKAAEQAAEALGIENEEDIKKLEKLMEEIKNKNEPEKTEENIDNGTVSDASSEDKGKEYYPGIYWKDLVDRAGNYFYNLWGFYPTSITVKDLEDNKVNICLQERDIDGSYYIFEVYNIDLTTMKGIDTEGFSIDFNNPSPEPSEELRKAMEDGSYIFDAEREIIFADPAPEPPAESQAINSETSITNIEPLPEIINAELDSGLIQVGDVVFQLPITVSDLNKLGFDVTFRGENADYKIEYRSNMLLEAKKDGIVYFTAPFREYNLDKIDYTAFNKPLSEVADKVYINEINSGVGCDSDYKNFGEVPAYYPGGLGVHTSYVDIEHNPKFEGMCTERYFSLKTNKYIINGLSHSYSYIGEYDRNKGEFNRILYTVPLIIE